MAHDNKNSGRGTKTQESGYTNQRIAWSNTLDHGDSVEDGIVVGPNDGRIYVPSSNGRLYCLDSTDGSTIWEYDTTLDERVATPVVLAAIVTEEFDPTPPPYRIVFGCGDTIFCLSKNKTVLWTLVVEDYEVQSCPAVVPTGATQGRMYFALRSTNGYTGALIAVSNTGSQVWIKSLTTGWQTDHTSVARASDGSIYVTALPPNNSSGGLFKLTDNGSSATINWNFTGDFNGPNTQGHSEGFSSPCIGPDGTIYFGTADYYTSGGDDYYTGTLWAVGTSGQEVEHWSSADQIGCGAIEGSPVVDDDSNLYVGTNRAYHYHETEVEDQRGIFFKIAEGTSACLVFQGYNGNEDHNVDATACIVYDDEDNLLAIFESEENVRFHKILANGSEASGFPLDTINRTDKISLAVGSDGMIFLGCRTGKVYGIWGFDQ